MKSLYKVLIIIIFVFINKLINPYNQYVCITLSPIYSKFS